MTNYYCNKEVGITKCSPNDLIIIGDIQPGVHDLVIGLNGEDHWMWPTDQIGNKNEDRDDCLLSVGNYRLIIIDILFFLIF
jgi:hypothetical protein